MVYESATTDDLKENGTYTTAIVVKSRDPSIKNPLIDVFLETVHTEDEKDNTRFQIAEVVDFVDIYGITKYNEKYYVMTVGEGELYIADKILYMESIEERYRTLTILIPMY
jgi:hypothetical protein